LSADFVHKTRDPEDPAESMIEVVFPADYTLKLYKFSPVRYQNLIAAKEVLDNVQRIFWGVREFQDGGFCYVGRPTNWYMREEVLTAFPSDLVYAVYINPRHHIYETRAEKIASNDTLSPVDWQNRFGGLKWKSIS